MRNLLLAVSLCAFSGACSGAQTKDETPTAPASSAPAAPAAAPAEPDDDDPAPRLIEVKGKVDDKPYQPVQAIGTASFRRDGKLHVVLELVEQERSCDKKQKTEKGQRQLFVALPWDTGAKLDLSAPPPDMSFNPNKMKIWSGTRWDEAAGWRAPMGSVTVFEAPTKAGEKGRIRLKVRSGQYKLRGDLPVLLCVDAT